MSNFPLKPGQACLCHLVQTHTMFHLNCFIYKAMDSNYPVPVTFDFVCACGCVLLRYCIDFVVSGAPQQPSHLRPLSAHPTGTI